MYLIASASNATIFVCYLTFYKFSLKRNGLPVFFKKVTIKVHNEQGFQSGPLPGTFTRLRSCIVPAEITEPPKISGGQNHKYDWLVEYFL